MVKNSRQDEDSVKTLTAELKKLRVKFDRKAYRKAYDAVYFRKKVACPHCGELKVKHMLNRHLKTKKCKRVAEQKRFNKFAFEYVK